MATRTTVETKIAAINDRGNNTALEVRDVLKELLDYTENKPALEPFHIYSANAIESTQKNAKLFFSIKGIVGQTANMTIFVKPIPEIDNVSNDDDVTFIIPFDQAQGMFTLQNFNLLAGQGGNGIIPVYDEGNAFFYPLPFSGKDINKENPNIIVAMIKKLGDFNNLMALSVQNSTNGIVSTSIAMHTQKFDEPVIDQVKLTKGGTGLASGPRGKNAKTDISDGISLFEELFRIKTK
jgi:hypothetical protein